MRSVRKAFVRAATVGLSLLLIESGLVPLRAQGGTATIAGTVIDQVGKAIGAASVKVKNDAATVTRAVISDPDGHFSITGLAAGDYTIETAAPGFALNSRRGVLLSATGSENVSITLYVDAISQSVTVQETVLMAAETAPQGNALDAMEANGRLEVATELLPPDSLIDALATMKGRPILRVTIRDSGIGIPGENMDRLYEPFFTTKPNGTGLGLAITRRIIQEHQGIISVESEVNQGTAFTLLLPARHDGA